MAIVQELYTKDGTTYGIFGGYAYKRFRVGDIVHVKQHADEEDYQRSMFICKDGKISLLGYPPEVDFRSFATIELVKKHRHLTLLDLHNEFRDYSFSLKEKVVEDRIPVSNEAEIVELLLNKEVRMMNKDVDEMTVLDTKDIDDILWDRRNGCTVTKTSKQVFVEYPFEICVLIRDIA